MMLPNSTTLPVLAVLFLATLIRSAFGFGEALVAVPLALAAQGCLLPLYSLPLTADQAQQRHADAMAQSQAAVDAQFVQLITQYRAMTLAAPGSAPEVKAWAATLESAYEAGTVARGQLDGAAHIRELSGALAAA